MSNGEKPALATNPPCPDCGGSGVTEDDATGAMGYVVKRECRACGGRTPSPSPPGRPMVFKRYEGRYSLEVGSLLTTLSGVEASDLFAQMGQLLGQPSLHGAGQEQTSDKPSSEPSPAIISRPYAGERCTFCGGQATGAVESCDECAKLRTANPSPARRRHGVPAGAHRPEYMKRAKEFCEEWTNFSDDDEECSVVCELESMMARAYADGWDARGERMADVQTTPKSNVPEDPKPGGSE